MNDAFLYIKDIFIYRMIRSIRINIEYLNSQATTQPLPKNIFKATITNNITVIYNNS